MTLSPIAKPGVRGGLAFVEMANSDEAEKAIAALNASATTRLLPVPARFESFCGVGLLSMQPCKSRAKVFDFAGSGLRDTAQPGLVSVQKFASSTLLLRTFVHQAGQPVLTAVFTDEQV